MGKKLITEVNRQLKLMGLNHQITESVTQSLAIEFIQFAKIGVGLANRESFTTLLEKAAKESGAAIRTIEDFEKDYALFKRTGKSYVPPSVYQKMGATILREVAKESSTYKKMAESILNAYRGVFNLTSATPGGVIIDKMIGLAKGASKDENLLKQFEELVVDLKSRNIIDTNIPNIIKNLYYIKSIPSNVINTKEGFFAYLRTIPGIKQIYENSIKKGLDRSGMQSLFTQVDSILRQIDDAVLEGKVENFDLASARNTATQLLEKLALGEKDILRTIWLDLKQKLPGKTIEQLESKDGILNYNNLREWFEYYEKAAGAPQLVKPNQYISRLEALIRIFSNPNYKNLPTYKRISESSSRILKEYLIGSARTKDEVAQLVKVYGKKGKIGFNIGERLVAAIFYYPLIGAFIRTMGDYVENTGMLNGLFDLADMSHDVAILHGETWITPGERKGGNLDGLFNSFKYNSASFLKPFNPSLRQLSLISPAFSDVLDYFNNTKAGDYVDRSRIERAKDTIIIEQKDTLQRLKTESVNDEDLMMLLDTIGMKPLNVTQQILTDTTQQ